MTSSTMPSRLLSRTSIAATIVAGLVLTAAFTGTGPAHGAIAAPSTHPAARANTPPSKASLLHPAHKYYGVSVAGAPGSLAAVTGSGSNSVTTETGKQPNLLMFYEAWNANAASGKTNIATAAIKAACAQGLLPMLTWESWNTSETTPGEGVTYDQPEFAPSVVTSGKYDNYIAASAKAIKSLGPDCPVALRFDQEENGYWYPWGISTKGMTNTAQDYIDMWRHVWNIFAKNGVTNVLWVWSPNYQNPSSKTLPPLSDSYPGTSYVDWVSIDAYYNATGLTFATLFDPTINQLKPFVSDKPWIVGETGVGDFPDKPSEITNLLHAVAKRKQFNGVTYFDQHKASDRSYWPFQETPDSLAAFKAGINKPAYAAGSSGSL